MTSPASNNRTALDPSRINDGFTLIELILVMALLAIAVGLTFPALRQFFHGRALDSEARRLLSLTRYGQSRAVAEGIPMILWIDERLKVYGLEAAAGYTEEDPKAIEYQMAPDLTIDVSAPPTLRLSDGITSLPVTTIATPAPTVGTGRRSLAGLPMIRLLPDGYLTDSSPEYIEIAQGQEDALWLVQTTNRLAYELHVARPTRNNR